MFLSSSETHAYKEGVLFVLRFICACAFSIYTYIHIRFSVFVHMCVCVGVCIGLLDWYGSSDFSKLHCFQLNRPV